MRARIGRELAALARPILVGLVEATGETAVLGALAPDADLAIYLDKVESANSIRYAVTVGERELYCTAMGKALLAHFKPARHRAHQRRARERRQRPGGADIFGRWRGRRGLAAGRPVGTDAR